jgi:prepilin-type N-terminal cleavage/methylation domain-containing protein
MVKKFNKLKAKQSGFTIVELLIVIVVIAILAAITIVAYGGITARANASKAQTNAANTQKVAEAYNADNGSYPITTAALIAGSTSTKIPSGLTVVVDTGTSPASIWAGGGTPAAGLSTVTYSCTAAAITGPCDGKGGRIGWWNFGLPTPAVNFVYVGSASSASVFFYNT